MYKKDKTHDDYFSGFFVFGGNGGGELIAFDTRNSRPWPVVSIDMTNISVTESVHVVAKDFASFLSLVGVEAEDA